MLQESIGKVGSLMTDIAKILRLGCKWVEAEAHPCRHCDLEDQTADCTCDAASDISDELFALFSRLASIALHREAGCLGVGLPYYQQ